ncbi:hypothetical protein EJ05DRAFT_489680 [Pseudovirgaria hyperparasitica]|uniref:Uncharacterized protein n=1 Tax=Pseudovirgaria hyperparasitica TaxID=470096 RepID=A0A6A6VTF6_9PEZI|nr:uncharacterized protein EJ05DRAFT_489680 [Pseudovirgaria hyperparasitica]KAF2753968.1 hypothetical protein EJ05DRAFT_489680 [Pseudovirgaria hyperparasitica]
MYHGTDNIPTWSSNGAALADRLVLERVERDFTHYSERIPTMQQEEFQRRHKMDIEQQRRQDLIEMITKAWKIDKITEFLSPQMTPRRLRTRNTNPNRDIYMNVQEDKLDLALLELLCELAKLTTGRTVDARKMLLKHWALRHPDKDNPRDDENRGLIIEDVAHALSDAKEKSNQSRAILNQDVRSLPLPVETGQGKEKVFSSVDADSTATPVFGGLSSQDHTADATHKRKTIGSVSNSDSIPLKHLGIPTAAEPVPFDRLVPIHTSAKSMAPLHDPSQVGSTRRNVVVATGVPKGGHKTPQVSSAGIKRQTPDALQSSTKEERTDRWISETRKHAPAAHNDIGDADKSPEKESTTVIHSDDSPDSSYQPPKPVGSRRPKRKRSMPKDVPILDSEGPARKTRVVGALHTRSQGPCDEQSLAESWKTVVADSDFPSNDLAPNHELVRWQSDTVDINETQRAYAAAHHGGMSLTEMRMRYTLASTFVDRIDADLNRQFLGLSIYEAEQREAQGE